MEHLDSLCGPIVCKLCGARLVDARSVVGISRFLTMLPGVAKKLPLQEDLSHVGSVLGVEITIQDTQLSMENIGGIFITN